ncbi:MAG: NADPH-dependent FMN reductase [Haliscomenobacter sp.]
MITIVSGTNRQNSIAGRVAATYAALLREMTQEEVKLLRLEDIPHDWFFADMYKVQSGALPSLQDEYLFPANKFVFVIPEYNGSYPGVLKLFLDACSVRDLKGTFKGKKAALLGVASGRAGNLRGMDHLSGVLHYLGVVVLPNLQPISKVKDLLDATGNLADVETLELLKKQAGELLAL